MKKIEGIFYSFHNKEKLDLSEVNIIRFYIGETEYIDLSLQDRKVDICGSHAIKIMPTAGSNCIQVAIK